jgi:hypothetical protein
MAIIQVPNIKVRKNNAWHAFRVRAGSAWHDNYLVRKGADWYKKDSGIFVPTFVVYDDITLEIWASNTAGYDFTNILIMTGDYNISQSNKYINLTNTGTIKIEAEPNVVLNNVQISYNAVPTTDNYYVKNVTLHNPDFSAFIGCTNMTNCHASLTSGAYVYCFSGCTNLSNCTGSSTGAVTFSGVFINCHYLTNCSAVVNSAGDMDGMGSCSHLSYCVVDVTTTGNNRPRGFAECTYLDHCGGKCSAHARSDRGVFYSCRHLTYCYILSGNAMDLKYNICYNSDSPSTDYPVTGDGSAEQGYCTS